MTDTIKHQIEEPILSPEILLEISPNEIGSYKINNLSKKFVEFKLPENRETGQDVTLAQMMRGML